MAMQLPPPVHETPTRSSFDPGDGSGVAWIAQVVPFQCSASGLIVPKPSGAEWPTAVQEWAEGHDTAASCAAPAPVGFGVGWIDHVEPFQRSASVSMSPPVGTEYPTAVQAVSDTHEMACSREVPLGLGDGWIDHTLPFQ
jgi:hypothetical protein